MLPARRARGPNEPGGIKFGHFGDMIQSDRKYPNDPVRASLEVVGAGCDALRPDLPRLVHVRRCRLHAVRDGRLHRQHPRRLLLLRQGLRRGQVRWLGQGTADPGRDQRHRGPRSRSTAMEQYEKYPTALETHFGGSQRASVIAAASGLTTRDGHRQRERGPERLVPLHAHAQGGLVASRLLRLRPAGPVRFLQLDVRPARRGPAGELRGPNYPNYAMNVGHQGEYAAIVTSPHYARGDA